MKSYLTRVRRRRVYTWQGPGRLRDRKLHTVKYGGLVVNSQENSTRTYIRNGDFILIEGDDADRPYVAKLLELYEDGAQNGSYKHAVVQWYARFDEIPNNKRKRLGREVHPQEIFLYDIPTCDNDIDAETIVGTIEVEQLAVDAKIPIKKTDENVLFAKMSWNGEIFQPLICDVTHEGKPNLVKSPNVKTPSLPKPRTFLEERHMDIICALEVESGRLSQSAAKQEEVEIESKHSASKHSHSKDRSSQRLTSAGSTPGARKKLQLSSPAKAPGSRLMQHDIGAQLWEDDDDGAFQTLEPEATKRKVAFSGLSDSPKKSRSDVENILRSNLGPLNCSNIHSATSIRLIPYRQAKDSNRSPKTEGSEQKGRNKIETEGQREVAGKTPQMQTTTPRSNCTPHTRVVKDQQEESRKAVDTPRSHRKSAQLSSVLVRQQLKFLGSDCVKDDSEDEDFEMVIETSESSTSEEEEQEQEESKPVKASKKKLSNVASTPSSTKKPSSRTPAKTPSKSPAPRTPKTPRLATPRIPERNQPARKPGNVLEEARLRLHVSAVPESLPCREQEYQDIYNFVESKLIDGTGGCMYISGVPGTGKTATVHEVIRCLQRAAEDNELPSFQYIEINGMKLTEPHQAYVQILKLLTGQKATADHAGALLEKRFSTPAPKRETTVLMVDELDLLWTRKQNVMYNLFDWPTRKQAKLIVLAIANTMDLPERIMMNRVASRLGLTRMSFQPYAYKQLQQIITSRLNRLKAFKDDSIQLVARKVAALSGDARRCLDICRRATEICEFSDRKNSTCLVGMNHVMEALEEMFSSPYVIAIRNSSVLEQNFLRAVISEFRRSGLEEALFQQVYHQHVALCRIEGLQPPTMSETMALCLRLGAYRLLLVEPSKNDLLLRVRLNVSQDDVMYALKAE